VGRFEFVEKVKLCVMGRFEFVEKVKLCVMGRFGFVEKVKLCVMGHFEFVNEVQRCTYIGPFSVCSGGKKLDCHYICISTLAALHHELALQHAVVRQLRIRCRTE